MSPGWTRVQAGEWGCWGRIEMPNFPHVAVARSPVGQGVVAFVVAFVLAFVVWMHGTTLL